MADGGFVGVDVGGTRIKAGRVDGSGAIVARSVVDVGADRTEEAMVARIADVVTALAPDGVAAVGLAVAGVIDQATDSIVESPNFPSWRDFQIGARLGQRVHGAITVDNDANAAIYGEALAGAGRGASSVIGLTLGTGVGGAIVIGGELFRGERGMAGELGHITVTPDGRACNCGNRGCLERYAGALGIAETMRARRLDDAAWQAAAADRDNAVAWLAAAADRDDASARAIFAEVGDALGQVLATLLHVFDCRTYVLCGGVARAFAHFAPALEATLASRSFRSMHEGVRVVRGTLGDDAALVGASVLARRRMRG